MLMARTIFKNLFSVPPTRKYPIKKREPFKYTRGHIDIDIDKCVLCGLCAKQCPAGAIKVNKDENSWEIDKYKCIICGYCTEKCPRKCLILNNEYTKSTAEKTKYKVAKDVEKNEKTNNENKITIC